LADDRRRGGRPRPDHHRQRPRKVRLPDPVLSGVRIGDELVTGPFRTLKKLNDGDSVQVTREEKKTSKDEDETK
jgi:hypothetical protein